MEESSAACGVGVVDAGEVVEEAGDFVVEQALEVDVAQRHGRIQL